jgi:hypothetical protein
MEVESEEILVISVPRVEFETAGTVEYTFHLVGTSQI